MSLFLSACSAGATVNPLWEAPEALPVVQLQPVSASSELINQNTVSSEVTNQNTVSAEDTPPLPVQVLPTNQILQVCN